MRAMGAKGAMIPRKNTEMTECKTPYEMKT
jgi:hypothetical protein